MKKKTKSNITEWDKCPKKLKMAVKPVKMTLRYFLNSQIYF